MPARIKAKRAVASAARKGGGRGGKARRADGDRAARKGPKLRRLSRPAVSLDPELVAEEIEAGLEGMIRDVEARLRELERRVQRLEARGGSGGVQRRASKLHVLPAEARSPTWTPLPAPQLDQENEAQTD